MDKSSNIFHKQVNSFLIVAGFLPNKLEFPSPATSFLWSNTWKLKSLSEGISPTGIPLNGELFSLQNQLFNLSQEAGKTSSKSSMD